MTKMVRDEFCSVFYPNARVFANRTKTMAFKTCLRPTMLWSLLPLGHLKVEALTENLPQMVGHNIEYKWGVIEKMKGFY